MNQLKKQQQKEGGGGTEGKDPTLVEVLPMDGRIREVSDSERSQILSEVYH